MRLLYLPAYSPDYNPIEEAFSALKAWIRRHRVYAEQSFRAQNPFAFLWQAVYESMTPEKAYGWFWHAGYV
jgi:transposase